MGREREKFVGHGGYGCEKTCQLVRRKRLSKTFLNLASSESVNQRRSETNKTGDSTQGDNRHGRTSLFIVNGLDRNCDDVSVRLLFPHVAMH